MSIENGLSEIGVGIKRIADILENYVAITAGGEVFMTDSQVTNNGTKEKTKRKTRKSGVVSETERKKSVVKEKPVKEEKPVETQVNVDDLDGSKATPLTYEDVKAEASLLVNVTPNKRGGFEKAQEILKGFGAGTLNNLAPEKYAEVIKAFKKAVVEWKN